MAKTSQEVEKEFIESLPSTTQKTLAAWMKTIKGCGKEKRNDIIKWLKEEHGFGHMHASLLMGIYANAGKPVYASEKVLIDDQFAKCPDMRPLFEKLKEAISAWDPETRFVAKKMYVSLAKTREFATINMRKGELRVGLDLGVKPFTEKVGKAKLSGPMPRISHMYIVRSPGDIDDELRQLLALADSLVHA